MRRLRAHVAVVVFLVAALRLVLAPGALAFTDVPGNHPQATAINDLAARGIIGGYTNGAFGPGDPVARQQFAKMIVLSMRLPRSPADVCPFPDVGVAQGGDPLYPHVYVAVAAARGITKGTGPTTFSPGDDISRAQVITMVVRAVEAEWPGLLVEPPAGFVATWRRDFHSAHGPSARLAEYNGLLAGLPLVNLDPWGAMPRAEVAQVLYNLLRLVEGGRSGDLWWFNTGDWVNVSAVTGQKSAGPVSIVSLQGGQNNRVAMAGMGPGGDLLVQRATFPLGMDPLENVSAVTDVKILGVVRPWSDWGADPEQFHVAATGRDGHLYDFYQSEGDWHVVDVSGSAGSVPLVGPPAPLPDALTTRVAALSRDGDVLLFRRNKLSNAPWAVTNLSAQLDVKMGGPVSAFQTGAAAPEQDFIAAVSRTGDLVLLRRVGAEWTVKNVTVETGYKLRMWPVGWWTEELGGSWEIRLVGVTPDNELILFRSVDAGLSWQATNLTLQTGASATSPAEITRYFMDSLVFDVVAARGGSGVLTLWQRAPQHAWAAKEVTVWWTYERPLTMCGPPSLSATVASPTSLLPIMAAVQPDTW